MSRSRDVALYLAVAITGIAAVYILNEWIYPPSPPSPPPSPPHEPSHPLPPLRIDDLPPPLTSLLSPTSFGTHVDEEQEASDTGSFVQVLSPPVHGLSRRRSMMRAHDLFAASHISFSELGSLVTSDEQHDEH